MKRGFWLLGSLCILMTSAAPALDLSRVGEITITPLEQQRSVLDSLLSSGLLDQACMEASALLERNPGDGFAIRTMVLSARDSGRLTEFCRALEDGSPSPCPGAAELGPAEREFALGLSHYYRHRLRSAKRHFSAAIAAAPGWSWPRLYRARCRREALDPVSTWEADLQAALEDPDAAGVTVVYLSVLQTTGPLARGRSAARALIDAAPRPRWISRVRARQVAWDAMTDPAADADAAQLAWREFQTALGDAALEKIPFFGPVITDLMSPADAEEFCRSAPQTPLESNLWSLAWMLALGRQERDRDAVTLLGSLPHLYVRGRQERFYRRLSHDPPDTLLHLAREALEDSYDSSLLMNLRNLGRWAPAAGWDSLVASIEEENPAAVTEARLYRLLDEDLSSCLALIDSLGDAGADLGLLAHSRTLAAEQAGDTSNVESRVTAHPPSVEASYRCGLARAALTRGDRQRARRHVLRAQQLAPNDLPLLGECLAVAASLRDQDLVMALTDSLLARCHTCAFVQRHAIHALAVCGATDRASTVLQQAATDPSISAATACALSLSAEYLGAHDLAETLLAKAEFEEPHSRMVRNYRARYLIRQRRLNAARELAQALVQEFPGHEEYRSLLRDAGGHISAAEAPASADVFSSLQHDLASVDWILDRAAEADTIAEADAVFLEKRLSLTADRQDRASTRTRVTVLIVTEEGLSRHQPYRIHFSASDPIPEVRVARVIRRDGSVVEVPRADILVTAPENKDADVGETRCLAIPFAALQPDCVFDLVYDREEADCDPSGWSMRLFLPEVDRVQRCTVEVLCTDGLPISVHATAGLESDRESDVAGRKLRVWEIDNVAPIEWDELSANLWDSHAWIGFSTYPSWEEGLQGLRKEYWDRIRPEELRDEVDRLTADLQRPREKLESIYRHVLDSVRYLAIELDRGRIIPTPPAEVLSRGYGDCKDMAALFTTMLEAAGIEAEPVLVSTPDGWPLIKDFPEPFAFNHMIVHVPEIDGGIFCDLTTGSRCLEPGPVALSGTEGMALGRDGSVRWRKIPKTSKDEHGYDLVADLRPGTNRQASIDVTLTCRGAMADNYRSFFAVVDSADAVPGISQELGYGLWSTCILSGWDLVRSDCEGVVVHATFVDTAWAGPNHNTVQFRWTTEVADPLFFYPSGEDRTQDAILAYPFRDTAVLRFHRTSTWRTDPKLASVRVSGKGYSGKIEAKEKRDGDDSWVEVRQEFTLEKTRFSADDYREFRDDWIRFLVGVHQPYSYCRALSHDDLAQIDSYIREHPDDPGFAVQAAGRVLGGDLGGAGDTGIERRKAARRWLALAAADPQAGSLPVIIWAALEAKDGSYRRADSLLTAAVAVDPNNPEVLATLVWIKDELAQVDERIDLLQTLHRRSGGADLLLGLISAYYQASRDQEASDAERRYFLLFGSADSSQVLLARYRGFSAAGRDEDAAEMLERLRSGLDENTLAIMEQEQFLHTFEFAKAKEVLERLWEESPLDAALCNNLAWVYAILGIELDRAEELANAAVVLSADPSASQNTLGAIYARQGHWGKARKVFQLALESDDRPDHRMTNEFFLGLCEYQLGDHDEALARWRVAQETKGADRDALIWIQKALDLHDRSEPVTGAIFVDGAE